jgi:putative transposase
MEFKIGVQLGCRELGVSRSGYYSWMNRPESHQKKENQVLTQKIKEIHQESKGTYGLPRLRESLKNLGYSCGKSRIHKLMKNAEISGLMKKRFKVRTTDSNHSDPIAPRIFQTEEPSTHPTRPNQLWASDISYIPTSEGFVYLATYLDVYTRKVVGFSMGESLETSLILDALEMALGRQAVGEGLTSHSDRGCQYASENYRKRLEALKIQASMSRRGNCYDNAFAESFFSTLKKELIYRKEYKNKEEAKKSIFEYIEVWYNRKRIHSSIGYKTPIQFEASLAA